jgi:hypothetical protein
MKTRPGASMCAGVKQGVNEMLTRRRHCEEHLRRSNPVFGSLGLLRSTVRRFAPTRSLAMTDFVRQLEMLLI